MFKNLFLTGLSISSRLLAGVMLLVMLARAWGPEAFGLFSFVMSLTFLLALVIDFGMSNYLLREVAVDPSSASQKITSVFWIKVYLLPAFAIVSMLVFFSLPQASAENLALPLCISAAFASFFEFFVAPLRALGRYDIEAGVVISANTFQFFVPLAVAWAGGGLFEVAWAICGCRGVTIALAAFGLWHVRPIRNWSPIPWAGAREALRRIFPYGTDGVLTTAWGQLDVVLVRAMYGLEVVGLYAAAQRIIQGASALAPLIGNVMVPRLAREAERGAHLRRTATQTLFAMILLGALFALPMIVAPDWFGNLVFGDKFLGLSALLPLFGVLLMVRFAAGGLGILVTAVGLQRKRMMAQIVGLAVFLGGALLTFVFQQDPSMLITALIVAFVSIAALYWRVWFFFRKVYDAGKFV